jgi:hypothetical protein
MHQRRRRANAILHVALEKYAPETILIHAALHVLHLMLLVYNPFDEVHKHVDHQDITHDRREEGFEHHVHHLPNYPGHSGHSWPHECRYANAYRCADLCCGSDS